MVQAVHTSVTGRVRYKVAGLYRSERLKQQIEQHLSQHTWVQSVSVNTLTGSVLVLFDAENGDHASEVASLLQDVVERNNGERIRGTEDRLLGAPQGKGQVAVRPVRTIVPPPHTPTGKDVPSLRTVR